MSRGLSRLVEAAVHLFFFSAVFLGLAVYLRPEFFHKVALQFRETAQITANHSDSSIPHHTPDENQLAAINSDAFYHSIIGRVESFDPYVTFIPAQEAGDLAFVFIADDEQYLRAKAIEFCLENYHLLSLTDITTLQSTCVSSVTQTVLDRIKEGKIYTFQEIVERTKAKDQASANAADSTVTLTAETRPQLVRPVERFTEGTTLGVKDIYRLSGTQNNYVVRINVEGGKFYDVSFDLQNTSPKKIAQFFCAQKANELRVADSLLLSCVDQVEAYIIQKLKEINAPLAEGAKSAVSAIPQSDNETTEGTSSEKAIPPIDA